MVKLKLQFILPIICAAICVFQLTACTPIEETIKQPELKYETQYPATAQEYNLLINKKIIPIMNCLEGHIAKGKDIIDGKYPIENEIISVEDSITYVNEIYNSCKVIMPPDSERERHSDTLMQIQRAINSIEVYKETLGKTTDISQKLQIDDIQSCINIMESEFTSLANMFNIEV